MPDDVLKATDTELKNNNKKTQAEHRAYILNGKIYD